MKGGEKKMTGNDGRNKRGQFTTDSDEARKAGRKGGRAAQQSGKAHRFTQDERKRGGKNSRSKNKSDQ